MRLHDTNNVIIFTNETRTVCFRDAKLQGKIELEKIFNL
jgi:hypothetical protein